MKISLQRRTRPHRHEEHVASLHGGKLSDKARRIGGKFSVHSNACDCRNFEIELGKLGPGQAGQEGALGVSFSLVSG